MPIKLICDSCGEVAEAGAGEAKEWVVLCSAGCALRWARLKCKKEPDLKCSKGDIKGVYGWIIVEQCSNKTVMMWEHVLQKPRWEVWDYKENPKGKQVFVSPNQARVREVYEAKCKEYGCNPYPGAVKQMPERA